MSTAADGLYAGISAEDRFSQLINVHTASIALGPSLRRIALAGCLVAAALGIVGFAIEYVRLGASQAAALAKVEREVRATFNRQESELRAVATALASRPTDLAAASTDEAASRSLFDQAESILNSRHTANLAVTVYGSTGTPIAWSGRPSELPRDRVAGALSLFVAPGPLGPRLVYVEPIFDLAGSRRIATVAAELVLAPPESAKPPVRDGFVLATALAPVALRTRYEGAGDGGPPRYGFVISSSASGDTLLEARVSMVDLARARQEWRRTILKRPEESQTAGVGSAAGRRW